MKIEHKQQQNGNTLFFPYWEKTDNINKYLPKNLTNKLNDDKKFFTKKDKTKRYFIDDNDITVIHIGNKSSITIDTIRQYVSIAVKSAISDLLKNINIHLYPEAWNIDHSLLINGVLDTINHCTYKNGLYKSNNKNDFTIKTITLVTDGPLKNFKTLLKKNTLISESINMTKTLINGPANIITIDYITDVCKNVCSKKDPLSIKILNENDLKKKGMNLILAVGRGSVQSPKLIEITYTAGKDLPSVCLIGKGVVFDSGGINLKPGNALNDMKCDMGGAATVLGIIQAASDLNIPVNITSLMPLAENSLGGDSFRPGDIITGYNKKTVEINNTDAEGRLLLADSLSYADTKNYNLVIDFATLTGSAIIALGTKMTAGFFKNRKIKDTILKIADNNSEPIWELPLFPKYKDYLKSDMADISNIGNPPKEAGTITAALFLSEFIKNNNWIHLDIAGPAFINKEYYYLKKGATGVMIRTILELLDNFDTINQLLK